MAPHVSMWTPSAPELILIVLVIVMLFGAKKLPELARGSGRALRIFKSETRGLTDDDETTPTGQRVEEPPRPLTTGEPAPPHHIAASPEDSTQRPTER